MNLASSFIARFGDNVSGVLSCFDRVIFNGYLPFHSESELNSWVHYGLRVRRRDFFQQLDQRSGELVDHARARAQKAGRPYEYRQEWFRKEQVIQDIIRRDQVTGTGRRAVCAGDLSHRQAGSWAGTATTGWLVR